MIDQHEFDDLVGAYALDACSPEETAAIEAYVETHPAAAFEVERLRTAAIWMAAADARTPPAPMRSGLLERARMVRSTTAASALVAYREEAARLGAMLASLSEADCDRVTHNGLTVRELVLHLGVAERTLAAELLEPSVSTWDDGFMRELTTTELANNQHSSLAEAVARWNAAVEEVIRIAPHATRRVAGRSVTDALLIRAFESWTHLDDVRQVLDETESVPSVTTLQAMVDFSVRSAPWALALTGRSRDAGAIELVLTGEVGGSYTIPLTPGLTDQAVVSVMTINVIDWCKRFADRRSLDGVMAVGIEGDESLASDLLAAVPCFAGL